MTKPIGIVKKGEIAFKLYAEAHALKESIGQNFIMLGAVLKKLKENNLYKSMEGDESTWTDCCKSLGIARQYSYGLIGIYEKFVQQYQIPVSVLSGIDRHNLLAILPYVDRSNVQERIAQAGELNRHDLSVLLKQENLPPNHVCKWEHVEYWRCNECGESTPVNPNNE